ncbi:MAG: chromate efflux transporter [Defluviicoccus sp.]|nr:chromate efflux transporter [Defluviicoccus sp.]
MSSPVETAAETNEPSSGGREGNWREVLRAFLILGVTSFGGPVAHIGYFREAFVVRRRWLSERAYADLVALCQFLPGPASSQIGVAIGLARAGMKGACAAWAAFTLPSALLMVLFAYGTGWIGAAAGTGWLRGVKGVAVAVVAQAVLTMARSLCPDRTRAAFAIAAAALTLLLPGWGAQIGAIAAAGVLGLVLLLQGKGIGAGEVESDGGFQLAGSLRARQAAGALIAFFGLLAFLPALAAAAGGSQTLSVLAGFYRAGALVFGGGHVVLPLLDAVVVAPGWISSDAFLAGYGAAQAVPGPLFSFAAYLGALLAPGAWGLAAAALCLGALYLPALLVLFGTLPFWQRLRQRRQAQAALAGINAAVVGLLLAALYDPVWVAGVHNRADAALVFACFLLLEGWRLPSWAVVGVGALAGTGLAMAGF